MNRRRAWQIGIASLVLAVVAGPAPTADAHGAGDASSNYRTRITAVVPASPELTATVNDIGGSIELTYTGSGTVIVNGYEGEPYLRIDPTGVARNVRSPATYLDQDRYARVALPPQADATAAPQWEQLSTGRSATFHDHRTHWMDPVAPANVRADPSRTTVIDDRWEIPLTVDGVAGSITGDLSWVPSPSATPWRLTGISVAAVAALALATVRWRARAVTLAVVGTLALGIDSAGYWRRGHHGAAAMAWLIGWPVAAAALVAGAAWAERRTTARGGNGRGDGALAAGAVVIGVVGGWDRLDAVTHSQIFTTLPGGLARLCAVVCLVIGAAIVVRFLCYVLPRALGPTTREPNATGERPASS